MKRVIQCGGARETLRLLTMVWIVVGMSASAQACQFWGIVAWPNVGAYPAIYDYSEENPTSYPNQLPTKSNLNSSLEGWSVGWHSDNPFGIYRSQESVSAEVASYREQLGIAEGQNAFTVVAHARNDGGSDFTDILDPHSFAYYDRYGKTYSFMHNGGINGTTVASIEDNIGAGFLALDSLGRYRQYMSWTNANHYRLDSQYYSVMLMKNVMIAKNYFLTTNPLPPEEWAVNKTLQRMDALCTEASFSSMNSVLAYDTTMWMLYRRSTTNDNNQDINYRHFLSYYAPDNAPGARLAYTTQMPTGDGWVQLTQTGVNKYVCLTPNRTGVAATDVPVTEFANPTELRISDVANGPSDNRTNPAISVNPVNGSFIAVWQSSDGNIIKGRWYDQMGMAEGDEFIVAPASTSEKAQPAVAHYTSGNKIMVVWKEKPSGSQYFTVVKFREFSWSPAQHAWVGLQESKAPFNSTNRCVDHPTVALGRERNWFIAWQADRTDIEESYIYGFLVQQSMYIWAGQFFGGGEEGSCSEPDLVCLGQDGYFEKYVLVYQQHIPDGFHGVSAFEVRYSHGDMDASGPVNLTPTAMANAENAHPAIAAVSPDRFVLSYYRDQAPVGIAAEIYDIDLQTFSHVSSVQGEAVLESVPTDIAVKDASTFYVCYPKRSAGGDWDIWAAQRSAGSFINPTRVNTTLANDQTSPAIAISQSYNDWYRSGSDNDYFDKRRMIVWQTYGQEGDRWCVAGEFRGITSTNQLKYWYDSDSFTPQTARDDIAVDPKGGSLDDESDGSLADNSRISDADMVPTEVALLPAYPNPFNPRTTIRFALPQAQSIKLTVYDLLGQEVKQVADGLYPTGYHEVYFDGSGLASGMYIYRLQTPATTLQRTMLLVK